MNVRHDIGKIGDKEEKRKLTRRRFRCIHCGYTWIEMIGLIIESKEGSEDLHFRIGSGKPHKCQKCGSVNICEVPSGQTPNQIANFSVRLAHAAKLGIYDTRVRRRS